MVIFAGRGAPSVNGNLQIGQHINPTDEFAGRGRVFVPSRQHNARYLELCNLIMDYKQ